MTEKRPVIYAIDFDGTICENKWPEIGEPIQSTVDYIRDIQERGDQWILYTMCDDDKLDEAMSWLALHGLHPDAVNDNLPQMKAFYGNNPRKVFANVYIDDHNAGGLFLAKDYGMDFGGAIRALKEGKKVARRYWVEDGRRLTVLSQSEIDKFVADTLAVFNGTDIEVKIEQHAGISMLEKGRIIQMSWSPTMEDMFSEDWVIIG